MYKIRTEMSQDCEYSYTYLKEDGKPEVKIGNYEGTIITELQGKLQHQEEYWRTRIEIGKDQLHCRNALIKNLRVEIKKKKEGASLINQILYMTNVHGVYKDDTDCINAIREAINGNFNR